MPNSDAGGQVRLVASGVPRAASGVIVGTADGGRSGPASRIHPINLAVLFGGFLDSIALLPRVALPQNSSIRQRRRLECQSCPPDPGRQTCVEVSVQGEPPAAVCPTATSRPWVAEFDVALRWGEQPTELKAAERDLRWCTKCFFRGTLGMSVRSRPREAKPCQPGCDRTRSSKPSRVLRFAGSGTSATYRTNDSKPAMFWVSIPEGIHGS
jgi:hypothetical protein